MSGFQLIPSDMTTASNAATDAAEAARGHGSSEDLATAAGAIPGADSAGYLLELGSSWDEDIEDWADDTQSLGADIAEQSADYQGTDGILGGLLGGLVGFLGGGS